MTAAIDLRALAATHALALAPSADADRAAALATWRGRMVNEYVSARVFAALVPQLVAAEVEPTVVVEVAAMAAEEVRHGGLCAAVVEALGGVAVAPLPTLDAVPAHADAGPVEALLRNAVSIGCLAETVAVALLADERDATVDPALRGVLTAILADEVGHARLGWRLLASLGPRLDDGARARLGRYLVTAFRHLRAYELANLPLGAPPTTGARALGVCDGRAARALFVATVADVIVPGLEAHGLPAARAWAAAAAS